MLLLLDFLFFLSFQKKKEKSGNSGCSSAWGTPPSVLLSTRQQHHREFVHCVRHWETLCSLWPSASKLSNLCFMILPGDVAFYNIQTSPLSLEQISDYYHLLSGAQYSGLCVLSLAPTVFVLNTGGSTSPARVLSAHWFKPAWSCCTACVCVCSLWKRKCRLCALMHASV